ncbi:MAG: hypothetical protein H6861_08350 [Rhodospirillales bacterium]|nr:hypothetical protein [Rhodospirillales bacterium]
MDVAWTWDMLAELEKNYASGTRRLTYDGKTIEFQSLPEMERAIINIRRKLNARDGKRKSRRVHLSSSRGV